MCAGLVPAPRATLKPNLGRDIDRRLKQPENLDVTVGPQPEALRTLHLSSVRDVDHKQTTVSLLGSRPDFDNHLATFQRCMPDRRKQLASWFLTPRRKRDWVRAAGSRLPGKGGTVVIKR